MTRPDRLLPADSGPSRRLRVCVVGAGPAGLYAADELTFPGVGEVAGVDIFERLPVPFGLLRYGVAPDHMRIKSAGRALRKVLERPTVRLFANVGVGTDVTVEELRDNYDAVVYALGASADRELGIPGEELPGCESATSFINWYNGHPERVAREVMNSKHVAVIGAGNVALDVARLLTKDPAELDHTDVPEDVLATLRRSSVTDVHIIARRAPRFAKFTSKELKELGELANVDIIVDADQLAGAPEGLAPNEKRNLAILAEWSRRKPQGRARRLHFHFRAVPRAVLGDTHVNALRLERADDMGRGHGEYVELPVTLILRSVGYRAVEVPGVPFDDRSSTIPAVDHRVVRDGIAGAGEYAVGWIKRGPTGILGTNRKDASETMKAIRADSEALLRRRTDEPAGVEHLLAQRHIAHVDLRGWAAIVEAEATHGMPHRPGPVKLAEWDALLRAADHR